MTQPEPGAGGYPTATIQMTDIMERGRTKVGWVGLCWQVVGVPVSAAYGSGNRMTGTTRSRSAPRRAAMELFVGHLTSVFVSLTAPPAAPLSAPVARRSCMSRCRWIKCFRTCSRPQVLSLGGQN